MWLRQQLESSTSTKVQPWCHQKAWIERSGEWRAGTCSTSVKLTNFPAICWNVLPMTSTGVFLHHQRWLLVGRFGDWISVLVLQASVMAIYYFWNTHLCMQGYKVWIKCMFGDIVLFNQNGFILNKTRVQRSEIVSTFLSSRCGFTPLLFHGSRCKQLAFRLRLFSV